MKKMILATQTETIENAWDAIAVAEKDSFVRDLMGSGKLKTAIFYLNKALKRAMDILGSLFFLLVLYKI